MPSGCSVVGCRIWHRPKEVLYHRFPKEEGIREKWVIFCGKKKVNYESERICSVHFKKTDYERRLKYEMLRLPVPRRLRTLKNDAIPTIRVPKLKGYIYRAVLKRQEFETVLGFNSRREPYEVSDTLPMGNSYTLTAIKTNEHH
ncbi:uncharacterized protein [Penaeus vannamei]|uniref:uncharacterized protein n=1 Tax=Penaeus vannamei TaxID=6689 RepID=UPI00387F93C1